MPGSTSHVTTSLSSKRRAGRGCSALGLFLFGMFTLVGAAGSYLLLIGPLLQINAARSWPSTQCTVISSEVRHHASDSDSGTTYSVQILYSYVVAGVEFRSDRYNFMSGSSSGYEGKRAIVDAHPPGSSFLCFYDPDKPEHSVIDRGVSWMLAFGLVPLPFLLVGLAGFVGFARSSPTPQRASSSNPVATPAQTRRMADPVRQDKLQLTASPWGKWFAVLFIALFWNGIVSVFVTQALSDWQRGSPSHFLMLFLVPFVIIGVALIFAVGYYLLAAFNPRPSVTISPMPLQLGSTGEIHWNFAGNARRISKLTLKLKGQERVRYQRGTSTSTDTNVFYDRVFKATSSQHEIAAGSSPIPLPRDTVPSFTAAHNEVIWCIQMQGEIASWPDVNEEFVVEVILGKSAESSHG